LTCPEGEKKYGLGSAGNGVVSFYVQTLCEGSLKLLAEAVQKALEDDLDWLQSNCLNLFPVNRDNVNNCLRLKDVASALPIVRDLRLSFRVSAEDRYGGQLLCRLPGLKHTDQDLERIEYFLDHCGDYIVQFTPLPSDPNGARGNDPLCPSMTQWALRTASQAKPKPFLTWNMDLAQRAPDSVRVPLSANSRAEELRFEATEPGDQSDKTYATRPCKGFWAPFEMLRAGQSHGDQGIDIGAVRPGPEGKSWFIKLQAQSGGSLWLKVEFFAGKDSKDVFAFDLWPAGTSGTCPGTLALTASMVERDAKATNSR
jgi:hypothetical protein